MLFPLQVSRDQKWRVDWVWHLHLESVVLNFQYEVQRASLKKKNQLVIEWLWEKSMKKGKNCSWSEAYQLISYLWAFMVGTGTDSLVFIDMTAGKSSRIISVFIQMLQNSLNAASQGATQSAVIPTTFTWCMDHFKLNWTSVVYVRYLISAPITKWGSRNNFVNIQFMYLTVLESNAWRWGRMGCNKVFICVFSNSSCG